MKQAFDRTDGTSILHGMIRAIADHKDYLSEVDGKIGDGDHGINMNKGFSLFEARIQGKDVSFPDGLIELGTILFTEIGGSMGPIYGTLFCAMGEAAKEDKTIGAVEFAKMITAGLGGLYEILDARIGDKTLIDTLAPAEEAFTKAVRSGADFARALGEMKEAAKRGREATQAMEAKYGRSSRLGKRSVGVLDAGAVSCCLLLTAVADGILTLLDGKGGT